MSVNCSVISIPATKTSAHDDVNRRSAGFHPTVWGDFFVNHSSNFLENNKNIEAKHEELKQEVKSLLVDETIDNPTKIHLIDAILRLGVGYHFESEIKVELQKLHDYQLHLNFDLQTTSIWFRLLRAQGFTISSDIFKRFWNTNYEFETNDARALWCLYEATHLRIRGENILEEALEFLRKKLEAILPQLSYPLNECVRNSLHIPFHKGMQRLEARQYIPLYEAEATKINSLSQFAKIDFNLVQALHQSELREVSRWWKELDFATKLSYARDRIVEGYYWIMGAHFEPKHSLSRKFVTKIIGVTSLIDDTYDIHGTLEEVTLFTKAVDRWEIEAVNDIPEYLQIVYRALLGVFDEYKDTLINARERDYCLYYAKEVMKELVRSYQKEAEFVHMGYVPTLEEYMDNSLISGGYKMFIILVLIGMGEFGGKETLDSALSVPEIIKASAIICRLVDDLQTYKAEEERGESVSAVRCYMKQYDVSEEVACEKIKETVDVEWKKINEEIQNPNHLSLPLIRPTLNLTRMMEVMYDEGDGYSNSGGKTKERIASLLLHPINI